MRKFLIISVSLLAFLLFSSKKCESPEDENVVGEETAFKAALDSINKAFEADYLSEQTLRAFEVKAKQKLVDFADYLHIVNDKTLDESFKEQARQMILDLFISDNVHISLKVHDELKEKNLVINEFLKMDSGPGGNSMEFIFDSINLSEPLHKVNDFNYIGSLTFSQRFTGFSSTNNLIIVSLSKKVDVIATKIRKQFGSDTLQIWQVYLGDIR